MIQDWALLISVPLVFDAKVGIFTNFLSTAKVSQQNHNNCTHDPREETCRNLIVLASCIHKQAITLHQYESNFVSATCNASSVNRITATAS